MQADRGCDKAPPSDILHLPAGGSVTVELAINRAFTTLSHGGTRVSAWPDGNHTHPEDWHGPSTGEGCLVDNPDRQGGALHTQNETSAAGTAFAISYNSDISKVNLENLVVFTTLPQYAIFPVYFLQQTRSGRITNCSSAPPFAGWQLTPSPKTCHPAPAAGVTAPGFGCPRDVSDRIITAYEHFQPGGWLTMMTSQTGGEPNMYMQNFKCNVTGSTSTKRLALPAKPPVYCADDSSKCVKGAKQMIAWNRKMFSCPFMLT